MPKPHNLNEVIALLTALLLFLLPWQTRYIYQTASVNGGYFEYGSLSLYATELLLWLIVFLFCTDLLRSGALKKFFQKQTFAFHQVYWLVCALIIGFFCLVFWRSADHFVAYQSFFHILEGLVLVVVIVSLATNKPVINKLIISFWLGGVVQGILGLWQFATQEVVASKWLGLASQAPFQPGSGIVETTSGSWLRAYGSLGGPNPFGIYLAVIFIIGLLLYIKSAPKWRPVISAGQLFVLVGLVISFSRGAWLAAAAGVVALGITLFYSLDKNIYFKSFVQQIGVVGVVIVASVCIFYPLFTTRLSTVARLEAKSISERQNQYADAGTILNKKWILGVGPGMYTLALLQKDPMRFAGAYQPIHNAYVLLLAELGIVGFGLFVALHCLLIKNIYQTNNWYLAVLVALGVGAFFEHFLWSLYVGQLLWWAVLALGLKNELK